MDIANVTLLTPPVLGVTFVKKCTPTPDSRSSYWKRNIEGVLSTNTENGLIFTKHGLFKFKLKGTRSDLIRYFPGIVQLIDFSRLSAITQHRNVIFNGMDRHL